MDSNLHAMKSMKKIKIQIEMIFCMCPIYAKPNALNQESSLFCDNNKEMVEEVEGEDEKTGI